MTNANKTDNTVVATNKSQSEVIKKPSDLTIKVADTKDVENSSERIKLSIANINKLGSQMSAEFTQILSDSMLLDADVVLPLFHKSNFTTSYGRKGIRNIQKLYGLSYANKVDRKGYKQVILDGIEAGYSVSAMSDIVWAIASYRHGSTAKLKGGLSTHTKVVQEKPTMLVVELLGEKYSKIGQDFYHRVAETLKIVLPKLTEKEQKAIDKRVTMSVRTEREQLQHQSELLSEKEGELDYALAELEKQKEEDAQAKVNAEADDQLKALKQQLLDAEQAKKELETENQALEDKAQENAAKILTMIDETADKVAEAEEKAKAKYQSKEAKKAEKLAAELEKLNNAKDSVKEAAKASDGAASLNDLPPSKDSKEVLELEAKLEKARDDREAASKEIEAMKDKIDQMAETTARQASTITKLSDNMPTPVEDIVKGIEIDFKELKTVLASLTLDKCHEMKAAELKKLKSGYTKTANLILKDLHKLIK